MIRHAVELVAAGERVQRRRGVRERAVYRRALCSCGWKATRRYVDEHQALGEAEAHGAPPPGAEQLGIALPPDGR